MGMRIAPDHDGGALCHPQIALAQLDTLAFGQIDQLLDPAKVDDLLQRRAKQIVLAVVARLAHGSSLTANLAVKGIMNPASRESQNARNPTSTPGFLAKTITCSGQIKAINQSLPNPSRATG